MARPRAVWALPLLLASAGLAGLGGLWDAGVFKTALSSLVCGALVLPLLASSGPGRAAVRDWMGCSGGRLLLWIALCALPAALPALTHATVVDRLQLFGQLMVAAACGGLCARAAPSLLPWSVMAVASVGAVVCVAQALGLDTGLSPGPEEIVGLSGNSIRAGALLGLGVVAASARVLAPNATERAPSSSSAPGSAPGSAPSGWRSWLPMLLASLLTLALLLTRARAGKWAALAGVLLLLWQVRPPGLRARRLALSLLAGVLLALALGGSAALTGTKLDNQAPVFSGHDPTTAVRLSLAEGALEMLADRPLLGVGLGRYRQHAGAYRRADEAELPGLAGGVTEVEHPHSEPLLMAVEGGVLAALGLMVLLLTSARRAWAGAQACSGYAGPALLALLATGAALGLAQDAWTDPATALPLAAALGAVWARSRSTGEISSAPPWLASPLLLLGLGLGLLAWPRLDAHMSMRSFLLHSEAEGKITTAAYRSLARAAEQGASDAACQRMLLEFGPIYLERVGNPEGQEAVVADLQRASERLAALAPVPRPADGE